MEDLVTAATTGTVDAPDPARGGARRAPRRSRTCSRSTIIYFTYPNPDGWRRGTYRHRRLRLDLPALQRQRRRPQPRLHRHRLQLPRLLGRLGARDARLQGLLPRRARRRRDVPGRRRPPRPAVRRRALLHAAAARPARPRQGHAHPRDGEADQPRPVRGHEVEPAHQGERRGLRRRRRAARRPPLGAVCPQIYAQTWGSVYDTINYTTTGTLGDWFDSTERPRTPTASTTRCRSRTSTSRSASSSDTEQLHVAGNKAIIFAHLADILDAAHGGRSTRPARRATCPTSASRAPRRQTTLGAAAGHRSRRPTSSTQLATARRPDGHGVYAFTVERSSRAGGTGSSTAACASTATGAELPGRRHRLGRGCSVQCQHCDDHVGAEDADRGRVDHRRRGLQPVARSTSRPARSPRSTCPTRSTPTRRQAAAGASGARWCSTLDTSALPAARPVRIDVDFSPGPATDDGNTGRRRGAAAARPTTSPTPTSSRTSTSTSPTTRTKFQHGRPAQGHRRRRSRWPACTRSCSPTSCCRATAARGGATGPKTADKTFAGTTTGHAPGQGPERASAQRPRSTDKFDFTIPASDDNAAMTVHIEWRLEHDRLGPVRAAQEAGRRHFADVGSSAQSLTIYEERRPRRTRRRATTASLAVFCSGDPTRRLRRARSRSAAAASPARCGTSAYTDAEKDAWVAKLQEYARRRQPRPHRQGAAPGCPSWCPRSRAAQINRQTVYVGQIDGDPLQGRRLRRRRRLRDRGAHARPIRCSRTSTSPARASTPASGARLFEPTPLGFAIQDADGRRRVPRAPVRRRREGVHGRRRPRRRDVGRRPARATPCRSPTA